MDSSRPVDPSKLLTLQETAVVLAVSVDVLLRWNEHQILKPTITSSGQIGYTRDQIDQFLKIQQSLRTTKVATERPMTTPTEATSRFTNFSTTIADSPLHPQAHNPTASIRFFSSATIVVSVLTLGVLAQQGQFNSLLNQYEKTYQEKSVSQSNVLGAQTSQLQFNLPQSTTQSVQINKDSQAESTSAFSAKTPNAIFANKQQNNVSNHTYQSPTASVAGAIKTQIAQKNQNKDANDVSTYANTAVQSNTPSSPNSLFDSGGNITGKTNQSDVLAMNISGAGLSPNPATNPATNDARNQLILIVIASSGMTLFLFKKPKKLSPAAHSNNLDVPSQKFLEIDQKMDGTVVVRFQGRDYKISKPELHSDSDRFFERLMEVVGPGVKEIEYDNYNDDKMRLSTPLSRLVTRLGFVGIKRDLFFPRTSKHNVLFRKYITREDLTGMNLNPDQVTKDLLQSFIN
ncbi:MAG TPA: hypothetical protein VEW42_05660 [Candidatus Eisenbacteria bacterium]|nr:hypothetical protein [Candidatus Eisenbacteria bacterium]